MKAKDGSALDPPLNPGLNVEGVPGPNVGEDPGIQVYPVIRRAEEAATWRNFWFK